MVIALALMCALAGFFAGFALHQRQEINVMREQIDDLHDDLRDETTRLVEARGDIAAHVTSLSMLMGEVTREDHSAA